MGGAIGATARHLASKAVLAWTPPAFPWGTYLINITGCFAMGIVAGLANNGSISPTTRLFLATGILGGYTTFSSFLLDAAHLRRQGGPAWLLYWVGSVAAGLVAAALGAAAAKFFG